MQELQGSEIHDFAALHAPVSPLTWDLRAELPRTAAETGDIPVRFTHPVEIIGMSAVVLAKLPLAGGGLIIPTIADIDVSLVSDNTDIWTRRLTESGSSGGLVSLSGLLTSLPRLLRIVPRGDAPDFTFNFSWSQFDPANDFYEDAIIKLSIFARYISEETRDAWWKANQSR